MKNINHLFLLFFFFSFQLLGSNLQESRSADFSSPRHNKKKCKENLSALDEAWAEASLKQKALAMELIDPFNRTALMYAVLCDDPALVQEFLDENVDPNAQDKDGNTVLHHAMLLKRESSSKESSKKIVAKRLKILGILYENNRLTTTIKNYEGRYACDILKLQKNIPDDLLYEKWSYRHLVILSIDDNMFESPFIVHSNNSVLDKEIKVIVDERLNKKKGEENLSALDRTWAEAGLKQKALAMALIDPFGRTALMYAILCDDPALVQELLDDQVNPNAQDKYGRTAFHHAVLLRRESSSRESSKIIMAKRLKILDILYKNTRLTTTIKNFQGRYACDILKLQEKIPQDIHSRWFCRHLAEFSIADYMLERPFITQSDDYVLDEAIKVIIDERLKDYPKVSRYLDNDFIKNMIKARFTKTNSGDFYAHIILDKSDEEVLLFTPRKIN